MRIFARTHAPKRSRRQESNHRPSDSQRTCVRLSHLDLYFGFELWCNCSKSQFGGLEPHTCQTTSPLRAVVLPCHALQKRDWSLSNRPIQHDSDGYCCAKSRATQRTAGLTDNHALTARGDTPLTRVPWIDKHPEDTVYPVDTCRAFHLYFVFPWEICASYWDVLPSVNDLLPLTAFSVLNLFWANL